MDNCPKNEHLKRYNTPNPSEATELFARSSITATDIAQLVTSLKASDENISAPIRANLRSDMNANAQ